MPNLNFCCVNIFFALSFSILTVFFLTACGQNEEESYFSQLESTTTIVGTAAKGLIINGLVRAYAVEKKGGERVVTKFPVGPVVRTDENGQFVISVPDFYKSVPVVVKLSADSATTMICDFPTGCVSHGSDKLTPFAKEISLSASFVMTSAVSDLQSGYENLAHISPLTHLATSRATGIEGGLTAENIDASYEYMERITGLSSGALRQAPRDLTDLANQYATGKLGLKSSIVSAAFMGILNSPDWNSISELLSHASRRIKSMGSLTVTNLGALPELSLDEIQYYGLEISRYLESNHQSEPLLTDLKRIVTEISSASELISIAPEMIDPVMIVSQPASIEVDENVEAVFIVEAIGGGDLDYQWRKNEQDMTGENNSVLKLSSVTKGDSGTYDVIVSNDVGSIVSLSALLLVNEIIVTTPDNSPPVAVNDSNTTDEDASVLTNVLENDYDPNGGALTIISAMSHQGQVQLVNGGFLEFSPTENFSGNATISYVISDPIGSESSASLSIFVRPINDPPIANKDYVVAQEDTPVVIKVLENDSDLEGGKLSINEAKITSGYGIVNVSVLSGSDVLTFMPAANRSGVAIITYSVIDPDGAMSQSEAHIRIMSVNDQPVAVNDFATTFEDEVVMLNVLENDTDADNDELVVLSATIESHMGSVDTNSSNEVVYSPKRDFSGSALISYTIQDSEGATDTASALVLVKAVNDPPVAVNDYFTTIEDGSINLSLLNNDFDPDGDDIALVEINLVTGMGEIIGSDENRFTFVPEENFNGLVELAYRIEDDSGAVSNGLVMIDVEPVNDLPVVSEMFVSTMQDVGVWIDVLANTTDIEGDELSVKNISAVNGHVSVNDKGQIHYSPLSGFFGEDSLRFSVEDGQGGSTSSDLKIQVTKVVSSSQVELSWVPPSLRENGEDLPVEEIKEYKIIYGTRINQMIREVVVEGGGVIRHTIEGMTEGEYFFSIATVDYDGIESEFSTPLYYAVY